MEKFTQKNVEEIQKAMYDIPFGNSGFQIERFVAEEYTPERMYRKVLLQLNEKIQALKEVEMKRKNLGVDIREIQSKLKKAKSFSKERLILELEEKTGKIKYEDKLINDAVAEISTYYNIFKKLPQFTRDQFELSEGRYWIERLTTEAKMEIQSTGSVDKGTQDSLRRIGVLLSKNQNGGVMFIDGVKPDLLSKNHLT